MLIESFFVDNTGLPNCGLKYCSDYLEKNKYITQNTICLLMTKLKTNLKKNEQKNHRNQIMVSQ